MHRSLIYDMVFEPLNSWIKDKRSYLYLSWHCQCSIDIKNTNRRRVSRVHGLRGMKMLGYETGYNNVIFSPQPTIRPIPFSFQLYIYSFHCSLRWSNHIILTVIEKVYETLYTLAYSQMLRLVKRSETARSRGLGGQPLVKHALTVLLSAIPKAGLRYLHLLKDILTGSQWLRLCEIYKDSQDRKTHTECVKNM